MKTGQFRPPLLARGSSITERLGWLE